MKVMMTLNDGPAVSVAEKIIETSRLIKVTKKEDDTSRRSLESFTEGVLDTEMRAGRFYSGLDFDSPAIGKTTVTASLRAEVPEGASPTMTEARDLFGVYADNLWVEKKAVGITDVRAFFKSCIANGQDPFKFLNVSLIANQEEVIEKFDGIVVKTGVVPQEDFLSKLNDVASQLTPPAKEFATAYVLENFKVTIAVRNL